MGRETWHVSNGSGENKTNESDNREGSYREIERVLQTGADESI